MPLTNEQITRTEQFIMDNNFSYDQLRSLCAQAREANELLSKLAAAEKDAERYRMVLQLAAVDDLACLVGNPDIDTPEQFTDAIDAAMRGEHE